MIIINSGMPKSGTSLAVRYQRDLIASCYPQNGIDEIWKRYKGFVDNINDSMAATLIDIYNEFGPFAVKTHAGPTSAIRKMVDSGIAKASFSFRDPRDTVLSALDHAEKSRKGIDPTGAFEDLLSIPDAINFARKSIDLYFEWLIYGRALFIRYEDFMPDKLQVLRGMAQYFALNVSEADLIKICDKHESIKETAWNFNKGTTDRWRFEMSPHELALCDEAFGCKLVRMGYERVSGCKDTHLVTRSQLGYFLQNLAKLFKMG